MQREIKDDIHLGETLNPSTSTQVVKSMDETIKFSNPNERITKLKTLIERGKFDENAAKCIPCVQQNTTGNDL